MRKFAHLAICALLIAGSMAPVWAAQQDVPLSRVAAAAGLSYSWLAAERAVSLAGPGIVIVIRPGQNLYEVDDRINVDDRMESTATTPTYANNDIYVSHALASHIVQLAQQSNYRLQALMVPQRAQPAEAPSAPTVSGSIVLNVHQLQGAQAVVVTGQVPPTAPVMITLLATMSPDLPVVLVSRNNLTPDPNGKFQAIIPIAPDYLQRSYLKILATSVPSIASASTELLLTAPNPGVQVPAVEQPGYIW